MMKCGRRSWKNVSTVEKVVIADAKDNAVRFDRWLANRSGLHWKQVQQIIRQGTAYVLPQNESVKSQSGSYKLRLGDSVFLPRNLAARQPSAESPPSEQWSQIFRAMILHENEALLCINKPANYATQGGTQVKMSIDWLAENYLRATKQASADAKLVHRLDKRTTGAMLIAKSKSAARLLSQTQKDREHSPHLQKLYLALVHGHPTLDSALIISDLQAQHPRFLDPSPESTAVSPHTLAAIFKKLRTCGAGEIPLYDTGKYPRAGNGDGYTLYAVSLLTGKKHQIRKQAAFCLQAPIVGDHYYAGVEDYPKHLPLFLHAHSIELPHSLSTILLVKKIVAPVPSYFPDSSNLI